MSIAPKAKIEPVENGTESELPEGWALTTVGECFSDLRNGTIATQNKNGEGVPVSRIETIQNAHFDMSRVGHIEDASPDLIETFRYQRGDIAFSHINSYEHVGKTALYDGSPNPFLHGMNLLRLRLGHEQILPEFAYFFLQTNRFREDVRQRVAHAVNQVSINQKNLRVIALIIAPADEQARIVAMLRSLLPSLQPISKRLERTRALLKNFRQAVLAAACSGKLTEDWRKINPLPESGLALKTSISSKRRKAWESARLNDQRKRRYVEPLPFDDVDLPEIPETWSWVSADEICSQITDGEHIQPKYQSTGFPMITATHVRDGFLEMKDVGLIAPEDFKRCLMRCAPTANDILIVSVGATTGRAAIVRDCQPFAMVRSVLMLRPLIEPEFLLRWIQSTWCQAWISQASGASAQPHFYIHDNRRMPVPLPPLPEQHEIVRRVDALFKLADTIEKRVAAATVRAEKLTQSILAKAFRGELVPTEAELARREGRKYEPASVLLERIKKEKAAESAVGPKAKRGKKAELVAAT